MASWKYVTEFTTQSTKGPAPRYNSAESDFERRGGFCFVEFVETSAVDVPAIFRDFDDYWSPGRRGAGAGLRDVVG